MSGFVKDKDAVLDFGLDWSSWLPDGDTIDTSTWSAPDGITMEASPAPSHTDTVTTVWLSGGTVGERYEVVNHILTAAGRVDDRTLMVYVQER